MGISGCTYELISVVKCFSEYVATAYFLKADVLDVQTPQKIQIFSRKIV